MAFSPVSIDGIGSLAQLSQAAVGQWLTRDWTVDPGQAPTPPLVAVQSFPGSVFKVKDAPLTPLGYVQFTNLAVVTQLTPAPAGALYAHCNCEAQPIRYRDDGTNPTPSSGMLLQPNAFLFYIGDLTKILFIGAAIGAILNVSYYS